VADIPVSWRLMAVLLLLCLAGFISVVDGVLAISMRTTKL
jgi:hypothetical protein